ncbi:MAG: FKBP-type peptidyl-prolyl cis-trans isomerase [Pseudomonadota bacterium]
MNRTVSLFAALAATVCLAACGGGGKNDAPAVAVGPQPTAFAKSDTLAGAGADAVAGKSATVNYTGYLYLDSAADKKGSKFDSGSFSFVLGSGAVVPGFDQGVTGMKVGGKRTVIMPSALAYGVAGKPPTIPGNQGLVFDVELTAIK